MTSESVPVLKRVREGEVSPEDANATPPISVSPQRKKPKTDGVEDVPDKSFGTDPSTSQIARDSLAREETLALGSSVRPESDRAAADTAKATSRSKPNQRGKQAKRGDKGKGKDKPYWGKRDRNAEAKAATTSTVVEIGENGTGAQAGAAKTRLPKRKVALLVGFCGTGCQGMQINPGARTIEGLLFDALVKAGAVSEDNADDPTKVSLQRAARTDAGVHAAGNIVSLKMITEVPGVDDIVVLVNSLLPPEIRVWSCVRASNSFNARHACDSRVYEYLFPSYLLLPPKPGSKMALQSRAIPSDTANAPKPLLEQLDEDDLPVFWKEAGLQDTWEADLMRKRKWRTPPGPLARLRSLVKCFEGTHNFHNYTVGREFKDRSNKRYMMSIQVRDPVTYGDMEWVSVKFHGQSFMLHQIRKMISMAVLASRVHAPANLILESYGPDCIRIPKAPALGLLLEEPQFGSYNAKISAHNKTLDDMKARDKAVAEADYRDRIDFASYSDMIEQFKITQIYERLRAEELAAGTFDGWIRSVDTFAGDDFAYLNPLGLIPTAAVSAPRKQRQRKEPASTNDLMTKADVKDAQERLQPLSDSEDDVDPNLAKSEEMEG